MQLKDIMTPGVEVVSPQATLQVAGRLEYFRDPSRGPDLSCHAEWGARHRELSRRPFRARPYRLAEPLAARSGIFSSHSYYAGISQDQEQDQRDSARCDGARTDCGRSPTHIFAENTSLVA